VVAEASPVPKVLFDLVFSIPNLSEMTLDLQFQYLPQAMKDAKSFPVVEVLTLSSPTWISVVECCPKLKSLQFLSGGGDFGPVGLSVDVVRLGKSHPNLTRLHCCEIGLTSIIQGQSRVYDPIYAISNGNGRHR